MSNAIDTYENHLADVAEMRERMRRWWWDELRRTRRIRKCTCGEWLIQLIGKKKNCKKLCRYYWVDLRDARPWTRYFRPKQHRVHQCERQERLELGGS